VKNKNNAVLRVPVFNLVLGLLLVDELSASNF
jgi:hypothetical protein